LTDPPGPRSRLAARSESAEQQIIDRYLSGLSLRHAGKPFGAGPGAVTGVLDRHGIARRRVGRPRQRASAAASLAAGDDDRFLRAREVTAVLGVSRRTTYRLIGSGELEAVRVSPRGVRVRESVLRAYLRSRQTPTPKVVEAVFGDGGGPAASRIGQSSPQADAGAPYLQVGQVIVRLTGEITTVGRGADCRIRLNDPSIALLHAELAYRGPCVSVTALAGPIGTATVNGQAVTRHVLADGDVISFGQVTCTVGGLSAHAVPA
jgi:excisionase family DNA binding protein